MEVISNHFLGKYSNNIDHNYTFFVLNSQVMTPFLYFHLLLGKVNNVGLSQFYGKPYGTYKLLFLFNRKCPVKTNCILTEKQL